MSMPNLNRVENNVYNIELDLLEHEISTNGLPILIDSDMAKKFTKSYSTSFLEFKDKLKKEGFNLVVKGSDEAKHIENDSRVHSAIDVFPGLIKLYETECLKTNLPINSYNINQLPVNLESVNDTYFDSTNVIDTRDRFEPAEKLESKLEQYNQMNNESIFNAQGNGFGGDDEVEINNRFKAPITYNSRIVDAYVQFASGVKFGNMHYNGTNANILNAANSSYYVRR
jgi:hypothetical protein